jgi:hypothetical protein
VGEVARDNRTDADQSTAILWPDGLGSADRSILDYWRVMFPFSAIQRIINCTNVALPEDSARLTEQELFLFFALLIAATVVDFGPARSYWKETPSGSEESLMPLFFFPHWGRFMPRARFEELVRCLRLDEFTSDDLRTDQWKPIRAFVDDFNATRARHIKPGWMLCVDESVSSWRGRDGTVLGGMPHVTKIKRKPRGVGLEMKDICDVMSGIMLRLELCEGKEVMREKPFQSEFGAGTASLLRLTQPWWGSGRVVCADSAFASVRSAVQLHKKGLYFLGLVKTASRCFPKEFLENYPLQGRGDHVAVTSKMDGVNLIGCAWNDNKRKLIVGTCGTTLPGNPHEKKRWRVNEAGQVETYYQ